MMTDDDSGWRKLCRMVAEEKDPYRFSELVDELVKALDARKGKPDRAPSDAGDQPGTNTVDRRTD
jgi:hypothetical protein